MPDRRFVVAGPQYPDDIDWPENVERIDHLPPADHPAFYAASRFTLNVTRADMRAAGHSPSIRLFEAGSCGCPIISDAWPGIETLFTPGEEILLADAAETVIEALSAPVDQARAMGEAGDLAAIEPVGGEFQLDADIVIGLRGGWDAEGSHYHDSQHRHSRESGNPAFQRCDDTSGTPACAGVTDNDGLEKQDP